MICPYCSANEDRVIDSRSTEGGRVIRRRRECEKCGRRFTTYERVEAPDRLMVVKSDGKREPYDLEKITRGVSNACGKRPIPEDVKRRLAREIEEELRGEFDSEVPSHAIGERVMARLRHVDRIAYIRFATEHLQLSTLEEIQRELDDLSARPVEGLDQKGLFEPGGPASGGG